MIKNIINTYIEAISDGIKGLAILRDPGADSGGEGKSKLAGKYGKKSPWGQCLTRPVPNGRHRSGF